MDNATKKQAMAYIDSHGVGKVYHAKGTNQLYSELWAAKMAVGGDLSRLESVDGKGRVAAVKAQEKAPAAKSAKAGDPAKEAAPEPEKSKQQ